MTFGQAVERGRSRRSSCPLARPVKQASHLGAGRPPRTGFRRHLEGWPLGMLSVGIATLAAALGTPRPVAPDLLPPPEVDAAELRRAAVERRTLAQEARVRPLSFEVRSLGELIRRYGRAIVRGSTGQAADEAARLPHVAAGVRATEGDKALLVLRAVQTELFLAALLRWEATGTADDDLVELGGDFVSKAERSGWIRGRLLMTAEDRAVLFQMRWSSLLELKDTRIGPTQNDWRLYYRFLLEHPEETSNRPQADRAGRQLQIVRALAERDPAYPALLAEGILMYRRGDPATAAEAFRAYLLASPDGAWQLRARNYLRSCLLGPQSAADALSP